MTMIMARNRNKASSSFTLTALQLVVTTASFVILLIVGVVPVHGWQHVPPVLNNNKISVAPIVPNSPMTPVLSSRGAASTSKLFQSSVTMPMPMNDNNRSSLGGGVKALLKTTLTATSANKVKNKISSWDEKAWWRVAAYSFVSSLVIFQTQINLQLVNFWGFLTHGKGLLPFMFRHDHWEWGLAVAAFFVWIHAFYLMDVSIFNWGQKQSSQQPKEGESGTGTVVKDHPWRKYRLQDEYELERYHQRQARHQKRRAAASSSDDSTMTMRTDMQAQITMEQSVEQPPKTTLQPWNWKAWVFELPLYMAPLYIWDVLQPRRHLSLAKWSAAPTVGQICRDVSLGLLLYDLGFFVAHYMMHKIPFIYKMFHAKHHINTEVRAADIVRLSGVEEVSYVELS
jgi:hypothetical protein